MSLPLLLSSSFSSSSSAAIFATPYSSTMAISAALVSRLCMKPMGHHLKSCKRFYDITEKRGTLIVNAFSDPDYPDSGEPQSESDDEEDLSLDKLPLDSKLQLKLEQKMRMKFSKKIRLRRKKLVHKRRMRKRGRWPPSKINKLKNV